MAQRKVKPVEQMQGNWLARDLDGWRVKVPCKGGHGFFSFTEYGGSHKALKAARAFLDEQLEIHDADLAYQRKYGELPERETINIRNKSGKTGICRMVCPRLDGPPRIEWLAYYGYPQESARFSTASFGTEDECKRAAMEWREKKENQAKNKRKRR